MNAQSSEVERVKEAAEPFAKCQHRWDEMGYPPPSIYTCLDREIDIARPDHQTLDWWPHQGRCDGCNLAEALGRKGVGTLPWREQRQTYDRLRRIYEPATAHSDDDDTAHPPKSSVRATIRVGEVRRGALSTPDPLDSNEEAAVEA